MDFTRGYGPNVGIGKIYNDWLEKNKIINRYKQNPKESIQVIHIDSKHEMTIEQIQFIKCIITNVKDDLVAMGFHCLHNHIPIFVVDEDKMKDLSPYKGDVSNFPPVEYLGWYQRVSEAKIPTIYICVDRIISLVDKKWGEFTELEIDSEVLKTYIIAYVVIHEFAHALMDNLAFDFPILSKSQRIRFDWIEEPMANAFVLHIAELFKNKPKFYKSVELFMDREPPNYKEGLTFYKKNVLSYWIDWTEKKEMKNQYPSLNSNTSDIINFLK